MSTQFVFIYVDKFETHRQKEATVREYLFTTALNTVAVVVVDPEHIS
jgi:hypothetical protein